MADRVDALFALDAACDVAVTGLSDEFAGSVGQLLRALQVRVNALVRQMQRERGRIVSTQVNLGIAQRAQQQLEDALVQAGYGEVVTQAYRHLPSLVQYTAWATAASHFSAFDVATLDAYRTLKVTELTRLFGEWAHQASAVVMKGVIGAQDEDELVGELQALLEETSAHARTLYDTSLSEFVQTCTALHSDGTPDEAFLYTGPIDGRLRPFCLDRVGRVFTRKAIDRMSNGQLDNTFITRGGYNCRHQWRRVSDVSDAKALADTRAFASPRIEADVVRAQEAFRAARRQRRMELAL